jgi:hypothetical protein
LTSAFLGEAEVGRAAEPAASVENDPKGEAEQANAMAREPGEWMLTKLAAVHEYLSDLPVSSCDIALATGPVPLSMGLA